MSKRLRASKRTVVRSFFLLLLLLALTASLVYWRQLFLQPAGVQPAGLRVTPTAVVAGAEASFRVEGLAPDDHLLLRPLGGPSAGDDVPLSFSSPLNPLGHRAATVAEMRVGQYAVLRNGQETGIAITAAEPYPPRPLGFFDGAVVSLTSVNFAPKRLHAQPSRVVIALPISGASSSQAHQAPDAASFLVHSAATRCGSSASLSDAFFLESCAHPGLLLAHAAQENAPLRLALDEPSATTTAGASDTARHCRAGMLFKQRTPGLAGEGTSSLLAAQPAAAQGGRALVVRHSFSNLKLSLADVNAADADPVLRDDGSWRLTPPVDPSCRGRVAVGGRAETATATASSVAATLAKPTHAVTLHVTVGGKPTSRPLRFELLGGVAPVTVDNFVQLCAGTGRYKYAGTPIQRIIPGFMAQGGSTDGGYGMSAKDGRFPDETFALSHDAPGVLSMANAGEDTNASQFFILFNKQPHLDGKHVVFGRLARGEDDGAASMAVLREIESVGSPSGTTQHPVQIATCEVEQYM